VGWKAQSLGTGRWFVIGLVAWTALGPFSVPVCAETQKVFLDFDSFTMGPDHVYTPDERAAIVAKLAEDYVAFDFSFHLTPPAAPFATGVFNFGPTGGDASEIDFRNLSLTGVASVDVNAKPFPMGGTSAEFVGLSSTIAAHEVGHLVGLRHGDAFGPLGFGIHSPPGALPYVPDYPGPTLASPLDETNKHTLATPGATGQTVAEGIADTYFGVREAIRLEFIETGSVVAETGLPHGDIASAQAITLAALPVSNTTKPGDLHFGVTLDVDAVTVTGSLDASAEIDYYSLTGTGGEIFNFEVISSVLERFAGDAKIDPEITVFDSSGFMLPYYSSTAFNDDEFETVDAILIDLVLPADGTYFVKINASDPDDLGSYELFAYRFVPEPGGMTLAALGSAALAAALVSRRRWTRAMRFAVQLPALSGKIRHSLALKL
jgi:hypothetical protein